uniref:Uncharacterized protein n=1 Tax=Cacopsylla melanoneura TaxID=428564 RepID=A0A8D8QZS6_9HEMI
MISGRTTFRKTSIPILMILRYVGTSGIEKYRPSILFWYHPHHYDLHSNRNVPLSTTPLIWTSDPICFHAQKWVGCLIRGNKRVLHMKVSEIRNSDTVNYWLLR